MAICGGRGGGIEVNLNLTDSFCGGAHWAPMLRPFCPEINRAGGALRRKCGANPGLLFAPIKCDRAGPPNRGDSVPISGHVPVGPGDLGALGIAIGMGDSGVRPGRT